MKKRTIKNFLSFFLFHILLIFFLLFILKTDFITNRLGINQIQWNVTDILTTYLVFLTLVIFIFFYSLILYLSLLFKERKKNKKVEHALKLLNEGQYSASIFLEMFSKQSPVQISAVIDQEILDLQEKLILISEEAVSAAQQVSKISKESKEEIIEMERKRIARELHDSVSQQLFAAAMLLSALKIERPQNSDRLTDQIMLVQSIIEEAQSEMRALLLHLRPVKLEDKSLQIGIQNLLKELAAKLPIEITYEIEDIQLTEVVENHLFRIIQELLSNVLRHAEADHLEVYFKKTVDFYHLQFIDDGKGFDIEMKKDSALGLSNIRERIERLGGNVHLVSIPNEGTRVEVRIPLTTGRIL